MFAIQNAVKALGLPIRYLAAQQILSGKPEKGRSVAFPRKILLKCGAAAHVEIGSADTNQGPASGPNIVRSAWTPST
ncbi:hypothetical protein [Methylobacterium haplocladii]|uniref:Uncharacterized protein n=1 Tax=Methylobacterium haplocladii TaxID=1176176 RepID=A0A512ITN3_9HYPH|nr:hypothetical protein [Methylobacterium haplocladii]GEP00999.1 hypothetical protein MHA02_33860 [Methylobacterium haplocladii]GJD84957.1 hypothetical protein HPGCJGGD_2840 [Methylobacterium haplocladii]GLS58345.1 hypothetical protein GCM10007887_10040 [Methylobacterium haplocladii]